MNKSLKRRVERIEQAVGLSGCDDPRAFSYPNNWTELVLMANRTEEEWQDFVWKRRSEPCLKFWDWIDNEIWPSKSNEKQPKTTKNRKVG